MSCARGCCGSPREHYKSIAVGPIFGATASKTTVDDHGTHTVEVTERHDGQDVMVKPRPVAVKAGFNTKE